MIKLLVNFFVKWASPPIFYQWSKRLAALFWVLGGALLALGLYEGLWVAPVDFQQGEVYRVLYVHVPSAWMSMLIYLVACAYAALHWVYRSEVSAVMMRALLPTGAWMTAVALITGALWGKLTWGTYWVWDARMTSELLLLFIYLGLMALAQLSVNPAKTDRMLAVGLIIGVFNIPLIYFSVVYWNTLHQGYSVKPSGSHIHPDILMGMVLCTFGFWAVCAGNALCRARQLLAVRKQYNH